MTDGDDTRAKITAILRDSGIAWLNTQRATDALIAEFPVLTTEPNETNERWIEAAKVILERIRVQDRPALEFVAAVLAVAPTNPTDEKPILKCAWCGDPATVREDAYDGKVYPSCGKHGHVVPAEREETSETKRIEAMSAINMGDTFEMLRNACYLIAKGGRPEIREITSLVLVAQAVEFEMSRAVAVSTKDGQ